MGLLQLFRNLVRTLQRFEQLVTLCLLLLSDKMSGEAVKVERTLRNQGVPRTIVSVILEKLAKSNTLLKTSLRNTHLHMLSHSRFYLLSLETVQM